MTIKHQSSINLTTDNLDLMVSQPKKVLANYEEIWETQRVQFLTKEWAKMINYEIPHQKLIAMIQEWADLPTEEREKHTLFQNTRQLIEQKDELLEKALPHLNSFFPADTDLSVDIHLTAFNPSRAFAKYDIVINVQAPYWQGKAENILNAIIHEIGHVGHSYLRTLWTEERSQPEIKHKILDNINSEGICTYIGYTAQSFAPAPDDKDYPMMEDPNRVRRAFEEVNLILSKIGQVPDEEIQKMSWDLGIEGRSYYVVGPTMCKVIDEELGRAAMIEVMSIGPRKWARTYNQLVEKDLELIF